ncbi:ribonuclease M5 [Calidifontibacillus erzurumensis]|uniref:Ribonuclease M5 n=1 Tax=Calidifontibacillus erzurumensis TaxID=2741433 RepID=A0A8J8GFU7_9BACI|nr:ribonuclease M5 [Calidifontibacillus erzurumensis]NSL52877.1 ribonuclease M5 [Calidifontibacillus erzurumensis]
MKKIKEIIVVEGKDDTVKVKQAVFADTIETNGSEISEETIEQIRLAQKQRGVIIFTDPDFPGERIRKIISEKVPGCKHAFLPRNEAIAKNGKGLGVEHASIEAIQAALSAVYEETVAIEEEITKNDLIAAGLIGEPRSKERREKLGIILKIGYTNGKQLHKRLNMFQIKKSLFLEAMLQVLQEEQQ